MVKVLLWVLALLLVATAAGAIWFRAAPDDPAIWHVDPMDGASTGKPNEARVAPPGASGDIESPVFEMAPAELMARVEAVALADSRTRRLAGGPAEGFATYVQRTLLLGFPDYVSVRAVDLGDGRSALAIWSRSRYGHSDLGVNRARLERWMAALGRG